MHTSAESSLVSVIIPAYNAGPYLRAAVGSILRQTHGNLELILVDDGSTDGSVDDLRIDDRRLRIVRQENGGKSAAMNRGLSQAQGSFYAVQDADDVSWPRRLERQVAHLTDNPHLAGVFCGWDLILKGRHTAPQHRFRSADDCRRALGDLRIPTHDGTPMYRRSFVAGVSYDEGARIGESIDYLFRLDERGALFEVLGECLYSYRIRPESLCHDDPATRDAQLAAVFDAARRRRGLPRDARPQPRLSSRNAVRDNNIASYFIESVLDQRTAGKRLGALRTATRCATLHPLDPHYLKALVYSVVPRSGLRRLRPTAA